MEEQHASEELYRGSLINVRVETLPQPVGGTNRYEIVEHPDSVAVVALRFVPEGSGATTPSRVPLVALVRQERPAIGRTTWEIPAGLLDATTREEPEQAAARELREETGYTATAWQRLASEYVSPGFTNERITLYLATGAHPSREGGGAMPQDPSEISGVWWAPLDEALALCASGEIEDGKTLLGLILAQRRLAALDAEITRTQEGALSMPHDLTNMPFRRDAAFRATAEAAAETSTEKALALPDTQDKRLDGTLHLEQMLLEEFNYVGVTAYQAYEDRARMFNLYLLLIGVLGSALGAVYQLGGSNIRAFSQPLAIILLLVAGVLGVVFFVQLIRLRQAFRESLIAMNTVKEFYIEQFHDRVPGVEKAFRWRLRTIPTGERLGSVTFLVCYTVAFLGSLCFAGAAFVVDEAYAHLSVPDVPLSTNRTAYALGAIVFIAVLLFHVLYYVRALSKKKERATLERQAKALGVSLPSHKG